MYLGDREDMQQLLLMGIDVIASYNFVYRS